MAGIREIMATPTMEEVGLIVEFAGEDDIFGHEDEEVNGRDTEMDVVGNTVMVVVDDAEEEP